MEQDSNLHVALLVHSKIRAMIHTYVEAKCLNMAQGVGTHRFHRVLLAASGSNGAREEGYSDSMD